MSIDPTMRFSDRVADYVRFRPHYPVGVLEVLRQEMGLRPEWAVADVGSGTGFSAELLLANGNVVFGIEPNDAMRAAAESLLSGRPRFHSREGRAEATGLPDGSVDLVVAGQAFHWFEPGAARVEFARILRPPRRIVLLWNRRRTTGTPLLEAYEALLQRFGTDYGDVRHDRIGHRTLAVFFGVEPELCTLPNEQVLDYVGLEGRLLSSSYVPGPGDGGRLPMLQALRELFEAHQTGGTVRLEYTTEIYLGRLS